MIKYLLPKDGTFYKANMHAHTDMSDGRDTPEQVKEIFKSKGYSIVAYTDHDVFVDRSHLCDSTFLALNGVEEEINGLITFDRARMKIKSELMRELNYVLYKEAEK